MARITMEEAIGQALRNAEELAAIHVEGDYIIFGNGFAVPVEGCRTYKGILAWSLLLSQKNWITPAMLQRFAEVALKTTGLDYPQV